MLLGQDREDEVVVCHREEAQLALRASLKPFPERPAGPDGDAGLNLLIPGAARILRWVPGDASATVYAEGFTNIVDFLFDDRDRLVVLEIAKFSLTGADGVTGRLVRVERNGSQTELASTGLENPGGVAYAGDGVYYVTNRTTSQGDEGQLLRLSVRG